MKLFKYEGYKLSIEPETLLLKPFKKIWDRDKTKSKDKAMMELGFIYFYCDIRSDYQYIIDLEEREKEIKKGEGMLDTWKPDKDVKEAIEFYNSFKSSAELLLEDTRLMVEGYRLKLKDVAQNMADLEIKDIKDLGAIIKQIPLLVKDLDEAERTLAKELAQNDKVRGSGEKSMYEDLAI